MYDDEVHIFFELWLLTILFSHPSIPHVTAVSPFASKYRFLVFEGGGLHSCPRAKFLLNCNLE